MAKFVVGGDVPRLHAGLPCGPDRRPLRRRHRRDRPGPAAHADDLSCQARLQAAGCAIVTASHNRGRDQRPEMDSRPDEPPGARRGRAAAERVGAAGGDPTAGPRRPHRASLDISFDYVAWLQEMWVEALRAHRHVVLDPMHGCWAARGAAVPQRHLPAMPVVGHSRLGPSAVCRLQFPIARIRRIWTSFARRSIGSAPTWGSLSTATATASPWSITRAWP